MSQTFAINLHADAEHGAVRQSCQDVRCENERNGWAMVLDPEDAKHRGAMDFIEKDAGRRYLKVKSEEAAGLLARIGGQLDIASLGQLRGIVERTPPGLMVYLFPAGQQCFKAHVDREVEFVHVKPRSRYVHVNPKDYIEDFNESADAVGVLRQRG